MSITFNLVFAARRRAISLIEGVLYLVIALAVIVGGIVFFQQSQLSNAVTDTARAAVGISSQARALYQNQTGFGDNEDLTLAMIRAGAVPSNFIDNTGDAIAHPFGGGGVTITGNGKGFVIAYDDISQAACLRLASIDDAGVGPMGTGIVGLTIAESEAIDTTQPPAITGTVRAEAVSASCTDGAVMAVYYAQNPGAKFVEVEAPPEWCPPNDWVWDEGSSTYQVPGITYRHGTFNHGSQRFIRNGPGSTVTVAAPNNAGLDHWGVYQFPWGSRDHVWGWSNHYEQFEIQPKDPRCG